jgi:hypothetical protein
VIGETNTFLKVVDLFSQKKTNVSKNLKKKKSLVMGLKLKLKNM